MGAEKIHQAVSAARFYIDWPPYGPIALSEISNISSKVTASEYIYNDHQGNTFHTKQFGKTDPPVVSIKRALDQAGSEALLQLHAWARAGDRRAVAQQATIVVRTANMLDENEPPAAEYTLTNAWVSELQIQGLKAGDSQIAMMDAKISCEEIFSGAALAPRKS